MDDAFPLAIPIREGLSRTIGNQESILFGQFCSENSDTETILSYKSFAVFQLSQKFR